VAMVARKKWGLRISSMKKPLRLAFDQEEFE
jgi:hypothetical protein